MVSHASASRCRVLAWLGLKDGDMSVGMKFHLGSMIRWVKNTAPWMYGYGYLGDSPRIAI